MVSCGVEWMTGTNEAAEKRHIYIYIYIHIYVHSKYNIYIYIYIYSLGFGQATTKTMVGDRGISITNFEAAKNIYIYIYGIPPAGGGVHGTVVIYIYIYILYAHTHTHPRTLVEQCFFSSV